MIHPTRKDALTDLEVLLWRLRMVAHEAQVMMRGLNHYADAAKELNQDIWFTLSNHAVIIVSKFLEVWDSSSSLAKSEPRIIPVRRVIAPFIDRILVWKGLRNLRNSALAHAYLDKNGELTTPWQLIAAGGAPSYHAEIMLLLQLVYLSVLVVLAVFDKEFRGIESLCGPGAATAVDPGPGISQGSEIKSVLSPIGREVETRLLKECGVGIPNDLLEAFKRATTPNAG